MENATYYAKKVYQNHIFMGCIMDPETVIKEFKTDIEKYVPAHFSSNGSNRIFATFIHDNTMVFYELPIDYKFN